jgi:hypothetical protein
LGCLSRIPDPDFYQSLIPDPKIATKERGEKKFFSKPFFVATDFTKFKIILFLKCRRKTFGQVFKELDFLPKNLSLSSQKYGVGIRNPEKNLSRIRVQGSKRHRIPDPDPQHCIIHDVYKVQLKRMLLNITV